MLNWNRFLGDLRRGLNSLNSDTVHNNFNLLNVKFNEVQVVINVLVLKVSAKFSVSPSKIYTFSSFYHVVLRVHKLFFLSCFYFKFFSLFVIYINTNTLGDSGYNIEPEREYNICWRQSRHGTCVLTTRFSIPYSARTSSKLLLQVSWNTVYLTQLGLVPSSYSR